MHRKFAKPSYIPPHLTTGREEQAYVEREAKSVGGIIYRVSNYGGQGGGTKGVPDDLIFLPRHRILLAWDSKAGKHYNYPKSDFDPRGRLSPEQAEFGKLMRAGFTTAFGWGDRDEVRLFLAGLATGQPLMHP